MGTLVPPGEVEKPHKGGGPGGLLPDAPLASNNSTRMWLLVGGGAVGAVLAIGVLIAVLRRRRRYGLPPARSNAPSYDDPGQ